MIIEEKAIKQNFGFTRKLIEKITRSSQLNNDEFDFYRHKVVLESGTVDYVSVTVYNTTDRYSGVMVAFDFDYWTYRLSFTSSLSRKLTDAVTEAFRRIYGNRISVSLDPEEYEDEYTFK